MLFPKRLSRLSKMGSFAIALGLSAFTATALAATASHFTVSEPTQIPGLTLQPGKYTIEVVDHLSERYVVRVDGQQGRIHSTFLALADPKTPKPTAPGQALWQNAPSGNQYMRGWLFPGEPSVLEFVYPKGDAVEIAKSNQAKVPAIDPVSEGRPPTLKGLSRSDLELVTLWLLSSTHVGPGDSAAGIQAERYPEVTRVASAKPPIARLPQTASYLPWIGLLGTFSVALALFMRLTQLLTAARGQVAHNYAYKSSLCRERSE